MMTIEKIAETVFEEIAGDFTYSNVDYIDTTSAHIGTEGIDELGVYIS
jgi:hypothetical protein